MTATRTRRSRNTEATHGQAQVEDWQREVARLAEQPQAIAAGDVVRGDTRTLTEYAVEHEYPTGVVGTYTCDTAEDARRCAADDAVAHPGRIVRAVVRTVVTTTTVTAL